MARDSAALFVNYIPPWLPQHRLVTSLSGVSSTSLGGLSSALGLSFCFCAGSRGSWSLQSGFLPVKLLHHGPPMPPCFSGSNSDTSWLPAPPSVCFFVLA